MDRLGVTEEQRKATLSDGQDAGEMLLDIEARIGELLPPVEVTKRTGGGVPTKDAAGRFTGGSGKKTLPEGIDRHHAHQARTIRDNPEIVAKIKAQARENEDIPSKMVILRY